MRAKLGEVSQQKYGNNLIKTELLRNWRGLDYKGRHREIYIGPLSSRETWISCPHSVSFLCSSIWVPENYIKKH